MDVPRSSKPKRRDRCSLTAPEISSVRLRKDVCPSSRKMGVQVPHAGPNRRSEIDTRKERQFLWPVRSMVGRKFLRLPTWVRFLHRLPRYLRRGSIFHTDASPDRHRVSGPFTLPMLDGNEHADCDSVGFCSNQKGSTRA